MHIGAAGRQRAFALSAEAYEAGIFKREGAALWLPIAATPHARGDRVSGTADDHGQPIVALDWRLWEQLKHLLEAAVE